MNERRAWSLVVTRAVWWTLATVGAAMYLVALPAALGEFADGSRAEFTDSGAFQRALATVGWDPHVLAAVMLAMGLLYTVAAVGASVVVHLRRPDDPAALFVATILLAHGLGWPAFMDALEGRWAAYDAVGFVFVLYGFVGFFLLAYLFPNGRFVPRWTRWVALVMVVETTFASAGLSVPGLLPAPWSSVAESALGLTVVGTMIYAVTYRYRRVSTPEEQQQTRSVGAALLVLATCFVATGLLEPLSPREGVAVLWVELLGFSLFTLGFAVLPLAVATATLRRGLWDTPTVLRRALLVTAVSAVLVIGYAAVVTVATLVLDDSGPAATTIGALLVALAVDPVRRTASRWVGRIALGDRDDAAGAVVRLSRRLDEALSPESALVAVLSAVREAVRSPGAAVVGSGVDAVDGATPHDDAWRTTLRHQGEEIGELVVERRGGEDFDATDRRLLDELARSGPNTPTPRPPSAPPRPHARWRSRCTPYASRPPPAASPPSSRPAGMPSSPRARRSAADSAGICTTVSVRSSPARCCGWRPRATSSVTTPTPPAACSTAPSPRRAPRWRRYVAWSTGCGRPPSTTTGSRWRCATGSVSSPRTSGSSCPNDSPGCGPRSRSRRGTSSARPSPTRYGTPAAATAT